MSLTIILEVLAFVCFLLATVGVPAPPRINVMALGLAFWVLAVLIAAGVR